jgi:cytochrome P450
LAVHPPGPRAPLVVQAIQFKARPLAYLDACAARYGATFTAGGTRSSRFVYISSPSAIQEALATDPEMFQPLYGDGSAEFLFGDRSMVFRVGEDHQRDRRLLTPPLHGEGLRANAGMIIDTTRQAIETWRAGDPLLVGPAIRDITLRVIVRLIFDSDQGQRIERLRFLFHSLMTLLTSPWRIAMLRFFARTPSSLYGGRSLLDTKAEIDRLIYEEIRERRGDGRVAGPDILTLLMSATDSSGAPITDQDIHDEIMTFMFAGHETTASALAWALYWLHRTPRVLERLRRELETGADGPDAGEISRLPYLAAVCQETLRLNPPCLSAVRVLKSPLTIGGYLLDPGTTVIMSIYLAHRRPELYPRPTQFDPDRFIARRFSAHEYLPFGGGHRTCIGMSLALFEMKLVLATILSRWEFAAADHRAVKHRRRLLTAGPGTMRLTPLRQRRPRGHLAPPDLVSMQ